jgi:hypothetical protein
MVSLDPLLKNRVALFWTLHIGGWLAYALSQYLGTLLYESKYEHISGYMTVIAIAAVSGFLLSLELRYIYRRLWTRGPAGVDIVLTVLHGPQTRDVTVRSIDRQEFMRKRPGV